MDMNEWRRKLDFHRSALAALQDAYIAIAEGGAQQYTIGSRSITKQNLKTVREEIAAHEKAIAEAEAVLSGGRRRKAVGVICSDW